MRIAHVTDFYLPRLGGIEMHVRDLAVRQQEAGHQVEVITSSPRPSGRRISPLSRGLVSGPEEDSGGLVVHRLTEGGLFPAALHPAAVRTGRRVLRDGGYDVVHAHAGPYSPLAFSVTALAREFPTVVTVHSLISYLEPAFRALDGGFRWSTWPAVWTAVSNVAAEPLRRLAHPAQVHVLPNGIDASAWKVEPMPRNDEEVLIVAVMRLAPRKRPLHLARILNKVRADLGDSPRLKAVIVGEGPERPSLQRYLRRHGMMDWVSLPGRLTRSQIRALFAQADMFVAPATLESFGIAALEARCAGLPVVARAEGGIREFVRDGEEGILTHSDGGMADAIVRLAADHAEREKMAAHNRTVPPPVTWPDVLRRTDAMYDLAAGRLDTPVVQGLQGKAG